MTTPPKSPLIVIEVDLEMMLRSAFLAFSLSIC